MYVVCLHIVQYSVTYVYSVDLYVVHLIHSVVNVITSLHLSYKCHKTTFYISSNPVNKPTGTPKIQTNISAATREVDKVEREVSEQESFCIFASILST